MEENYYYDQNKKRYVKQDYENSIEKKSCYGIICKDNLDNLNVESLVLVVKEKHHPNKYQFPGGGGENEENYITCLNRELNEEINFSINCDLTKDYNYVLGRENENNNDPLLVFETKTKFRPVEVEAFYDNTLRFYFLSMGMWKNNCESNENNNDNNHDDNIEIDEKEIKEAKWIKIKELSAENVMELHLPVVRLIKERN
eukprot:TRINITY_DN1115_c2_g1_i1.p1 TRINITY_DN1115_c2_g1~~TRINITY_DN1115_c2_g1_i1.p1  ORF type:complete len:200 (+),score=52.88 TRINITY_DN1115_c2_g1_i1:147-746(+)